MVSCINLPRLVLRAPDPAMAGAVEAYYRRNRDFLAPFEPATDESFYTADYQRTRLAAEAEDFGQSSCRFYLFRPEHEDELIGTIALSSIVRGCFLSCFLGYKLDRAYLNRGYMTDAVNAIVDVAFTELSLHRVEANVMPHNTPSLRVLQKCGFAEEGRSEKYLKINGTWQDHIHMVKRNGALE